MHTGNNYMIPKMSASYYTVLEYSTMSPSSRGHCVCVKVSPIATRAPSPPGRVTNALQLEQI